MSNYASQVFDAYFFEKNVQGDIIGIYAEDERSYVRRGTKIFEMFGWD